VHISGILVTTRPDDTAACIEDLAALAGVEVHHRQPESGRIVVVQEGTSVEEQEDGLRRIQALPRVVSACLVQHVVDPDAPDARPTREESRP
jgi:nitrate reductase NapD